MYSSMELFVRKFLSSKPSILEYSFQYLSIQNRCKVENLCKSPILEYAKPILEYTIVVKIGKLSVKPILEYSFLYLSIDSY